MKRGLLFLTLLVGGVLLLGCGEGGNTMPPPATSSGPTRLPLAAPPPTVGPLEERPAGEEEVPRITPAELWDRLQAGEAILIVDARAYEAYEQEHIVGAISIPQGQIGQRKDEIPRDRLVVFY